MASVTEIVPVNNLQQEQIKVLKRQLSEIQDLIKNKTVQPSEDPELNKVITENVKLKHRLSILNRVSNFIYLVVSVILLLSKF